MEDENVTTVSEIPSGIVEHIERRGGVCGGRPCVKGTRIRVWDIHVWHDLRGRSPQEIVAAFPELTVADVHAALAWYLDHREEIENEMKQAAEFAARLEDEQGPSRLSKLRHQPLTALDGQSHQIPPG